MVNASPVNLTHLFSYLIKTGQKCFVIDGLLS